MKRWGLIFLRVVATSFVAANGQPATMLSTETNSSGGTWRSSGTCMGAHRAAPDRNATVYQPHTSEASLSTTTNFLTGTESKLRMPDANLLDAHLKELPATVPHTLDLVPEPVVRGGMAGGAISLKVGAVMEVRLDANHTTGYSWIVAPVANPVLMRQGKAEYLDNAAENRVGAGSVEVWRFKAMKAGKQSLQFEYRRPWEKGTPPAKMVTFSVTVE
jgi:predicted secreted protein